MTAPVEIRLLGAVSVVVGREEIALGGRKQQSLLALLALRSPESVSTDLCLEALWGDGVTDTSVHTLHTYVSNLRRLFDGTGAIAIERATDGYRLTAGPEVLDLARFRRQLIQAHEGTAEERAARLRAALDLWRGPPLGDLGTEPWAQAAVTEITEVMLASVTVRLDLDLELGRHRQLVAELEALVVDHPYREDIWSRLVLALYRSGRQADALAACQRVRAVLGDDLGIEPGFELTDLEDKVLLHDSSLELSSAPRQSTLPHPRSELIGRDELIDEVIGLIDTERVVTLVGPGGVGKTSAAVVAAHRVRLDFNGIWFCDLVPVSAGGVQVAVAASLGLHVTDPTAARERVVRWIGDQRVVLVLDNCEHLLTEVAGFVKAVVDQCGGLSVLATSREPIGVGGEWIVHVPPLSSSAALEVLRQRARAATGSADDRRLDELAERLDALPLALELAAARLSHMTVDEILDRLDDRLRLLTTRRDTNSRHSALETTIDWSYRLLTDAEQSMLRAVSVFAESFDLEGARAVGGGDEFDALDLIGSLVAKSLLVTDRDRTTTRYRLLETVRAFCQVRLDEAGETKARTRAHAEFHLRRADDIPPHPPDAHPWAQLIDIDLSRTIGLADRLLAWNWLIANDRLQAAARLHARMLTLDHQHHFDPDCRVMERADIAITFENDAEKALYCLASALQANRLGRWESTFAFSVQALELDADPHISVVAAGLAAQVATWREPDRVDEFLRIGHDRLPAASSALAEFLVERRGDALFVQGRIEEAIVLLQELRRAGNRWAGFELCVAFHLIDADHLVEAHIDAMTSAEMSSALRYRLHLARALAAIARANPDEARRHLIAAGQEALRHHGELFDRDVLIGCAALALSLGDHERSSELLASVGGTTRTPATIALHDRYRDRIRAELDRGTVDRIRERARGQIPAEVLKAELARLEAP